MGDSYELKGTELTSPTQRHEQMNVVYIMYCMAIKYAAR